MVLETSTLTDDVGVRIDWRIWSCCREPSHEIWNVCCRYVYLAWIIVLCCIHIIHLVLSEL